MRRYNTCYKRISKRKRHFSSLMSLALLTFAVALILIFFGCAQKEPADAPTDETSADAVTADAVTETETAQEPYTPKTVTVMVYMTGSDLESRGGFGTEDLDEMAGSGVDVDRVTLLVYTGGSKTWQNDLPADRNVLLRLTEEGFVKETDFDLLSMGDPENLTRFTAYAKENYPAEEYDLILWDHGNGPVMGYGKDKLFDDDSLTLTELGEALEAGPFGPEDRLGILGFDACLMASVELACVTKDYAEYLVASEELEPGIGWYYGFLSQAGLVSPRTLAHGIVDGFFTAVEEYAAERENYDADITLSVTDLRAVEPLQEALEQYFADAANHVSGDYNKLASARANAKGFARGSSEYDLIDLGSLLDVRAEAGDKKAKAVREALDAAVDYSRSNVEDCSGLSLYYPYYNKHYYQNSWREDYLSLDTLGSYQTYLERYEQVWLGSDLQDLFANGLTPQSANDGRHYTLQLTPEQKEAYAKSRYCVLRRNGLEAYHLIYSSWNVTEENGLLTADFNGNVGYVSDDYFGPFDIMLISKEKTGTSESYFTAGLLTSPDDEIVVVQIYLRVDLDTGEMTVTGIYDAEDNDAGGKKEPLELKPGYVLEMNDAFSSYLTRAENGRILPILEWESTSESTGFMLNAGDNIRFTFEPLYDRGDEYFMMFEIVDTQGNSSCSELIPITLAAPPEETTPEQTAQTFDMPASGELTLPLADGFSLDLNCFYSAKWAQPVLHGVLNCEIEGEYELETYRLRNSQTKQIANKYYFYCFMNNSGSAKATGKTVSHTGSVYPDSMRCSGFEDLWTLAFRVRVYDKSKTKTVVPLTGFLIHLPAADGLPIRVEPFMGAQADRQLLLEKDGLRVTLLMAGSILNSINADKEPGAASDCLELWLLFENGADAEQSIDCYSLWINGLEFHCNNNSFTLAPGLKKTLKLEFSRSAVDIMTEDYIFHYYSLYDIYGSEDYSIVQKNGQIRSISSIQVPLQINGENVLCEAELRIKGDGAAVVPDGEPIYEDGTFTIWAADSRWFPDFTHGVKIAGAACAYWVRNNTEDQIFAYVGDEFNNAACFDIGPGGLRYVLCPEYIFEESDVIETILTWRTLPGKPEFHTTGSFQLVREGGAQP